MSVDRWFRRLLRLLPSDVRDDYGSEMARVFRQQRREAADVGRLEVVKLWLRTVGDLLAVAPGEHLDQIRQDVTYALRSMRRNAAFTAVAILTLALGLGANTAIFSVVHAVLLRPLPYSEPDRLVAVWNRWDGSPAASLSNPEYLDYAERTRTMTIAASASTAVNVGGSGGDPERVIAGLMSIDALDVLGVRPALGRAFGANDAKPGAPCVALLSDGFWRRRFDADRTIVGRRISVNEAPCEVIGVMAPGVVLPYEIRTISRAALYGVLPLDAAAPRHIRGGHYIQAFARLRPGESAASAAAEMEAILRPLIQAYPDEHDQGNFGITIRSLRVDLLGDARGVLLVISGSVALVLLLACSNVVNLLLARGASRRRELAVRTALGASRGRIVRQLLTESVLLSVAGAAAGVAMAYWVQRVVLGMAGGALPRLDEVAVDRPVLLFAASLAAACGLLFGSVPALQSTRRVADFLKDGMRGATDGASVRLRSGLVVVQVSVAVVLLVAAGLLAKSYARLTAVPTGFQSAGVLTMRVTLPAARYPGRPEVAGFFSRVVARVAALPGVLAAGAGSGLPLAAPSGDWSFDIEGRPRIGSRYPAAADWYVVTPGYFETLGVPLKRGRLPAAGDVADAMQVVFINEATARAFFSNQDPIGRRIRLSQGTNTAQPWRTIAGIVGDVRFRGLDTPPRPELFIPHEQFLHFSAGGQARSMTVVVRSEGTSAVSPAVVRAELRRLDADVPAAAILDMATVVRQSLSDWRLNLMLVGVFGVLALTLAAVGLYGVMAYNVAQRTRELGVRIAMGATRATVLRDVMADGLRLVVVGVVCGLVAAVALGGTVHALLFEVQARDVAVLATVPAVLLVAGTVACLVPARRAVRVDPVVALRAE